MLKLAANHDFTLRQIGEIIYRKEDNEEASDFEKLI